MKEHGPVWKYVLIIEKKDKGNPKIQCCFCELVFVGGPEHICEHLRGEQNALVKPCKKVPENVSDEMHELLQKKLDAKQLKRKSDLLDKATCSSSKVSKPLAESCQQTLPVMLESVARAFYSAGIPFAVANNSHVKQAFMNITKFGSGYSLPSEFMLCTSLLATEVNRLKCDIDTKIMNHLDATPGTTVSDGWSNVKKNHLSTTF